MKKSDQNRLEDLEAKNIELEGRIESLEVELDEFKEEYEVVCKKVQDLIKHVKGGDEDLEDEDPWDDDWNQ